MVDIILLQNMFYKVHFILTLLISLNNYMPYQFDQVLFTLSIITIIIISYNN